MAEIVLVHGIAQEQKSADTLEKEWLPDLAGGVRTAGGARLADELWRSARPGRLESRMAFYGDVFLKKGAQGAAEDPAELTGTQQELTDALALEWLRNARDRAPEPGDRRIARTVLYDIEGGDEGRQGRRSAGRAAVNGLARLKWFSRLGMGFAQRFVNKSLVQVTRYMTEPSVYEEVQQRIADLIGPETRILVGHSLGSVAAYEAALRLEGELPLLLTLGSPLGLRTFVHDRLDGEHQVPELVGRWVNLADKDDVIAAEPDLAKRFADPRGVLESDWTLNNGEDDPHSAQAYLTKLQTGRAVREALEPR
ncbi:hypothetical protein OG588_14970 [Streptomyces prunicolor]|uniref:hypothetical protein n=1 Tax=Streptomyces prunicolor TaxID=67348 RepID=UPI00387090A0|nr:hypothetical protein OG588_14970 [Streptomyces prunicolor]